MCVGGIIPKDNIIEIKAGYRLKKAGMKTEVYMSFFLFFVQMDAVRPFYCSRDISSKNPKRSYLPEILPLKGGYSIKTALINCIR